MRLNSCRTENKIQNLAKPQEMAQPAREAERFQYGLLVQHEMLDRQKRTGGEKGRGSHTVRTVKCLWNTHTKGYNCSFILKFLLSFPYRIQHIYNMVLMKITKNERTTSKLFVQETMDIT